MKNKASVLYHYCDITTFCNIIKNRSIWFSDISKSNDSQELKWIKGQCKGYILKVWVDYLRSVEAEKGDLRTVNFGQFEELQTVVEDLYNYETEKCWTFCVSEKADDLGQWRGYAKDGEGIAIGFTSSFFKSLQKEGKPEITASNQVAFDKVLYNEKDVERLFLEMCGLAKINPQMTSEEVIKLLKSAVTASLLLAPFYKNPTFAEEKEWRLVFSTITSNLLSGQTPEAAFQKMFPTKAVHYDFVVQNQQFVSHIEFVDSMMPNNICEIWLGPKCKISSLDLKLFLVSNGYLKDCSDTSIQIYKSEASYR